MIYLRSFLSIVVLLNLLVFSAAASTVQSMTTATLRVQKLRWNGPAIKISVSRSMFAGATNIKYGSDVDGAIRRSLDAWQSVADIEFVEEISDIQNVSPAGVAGDGASLITIAPTQENVLMFGKNDESTAAKTRVFYNRRGAITEADIVLSPFQQFSTDGTYGTFDLETTLKHEVGHLLGLRHSTVIGSIMYDVSARNGAFGDSIYAAANPITADDISAIRDLYGYSKDEDCCGTLSGRLAGVGRNARGVDVWFSEVETGAVVGHTTASKDGSFSIGGLKTGSYSISGRENSPSDYSTFDLGSTIVTNGDNLPLSRRLVHRPRDFAVQLIGKNGILSDSPLRLQRGNSYTVYLGGKNLSAGRVHVESNSPFLLFDQNSLSDQPYDGGISGLSFVVSVADESPNGNYNICVVSSGGVRDCFVGGISIVD